MERKRAKFVGIALVLTVWTCAAACGGGGGSSHDTPDPAGDPQEGGSSSTHGTLGCWGYLKCRVDCDLNDEGKSCKDRCLARADEEVLDLGDAIDTCIQASKCDDLSCVYERCAYPMAACLSDIGGTPAASSGTCVEYLSCIALCPAQSTYACQTDCSLGVEDYEASYTADDLTFCVETSGCTNLVCLENTCKNLRSACMTP